MDDINRYNVDPYSMGKSSQVTWSLSQPAFPRRLTGAENPWATVSRGPRFSDGAWWRNVWNPRKNICSQYITYSIITYIYISCLQRNVNIYIYIYIYLHCQYVWRNDSIFHIYIYIMTSKSTPQISPMAKSMVFRRWTALPDASLPIWFSGKAFLHGVST